MAEKTTAEIQHLVNLSGITIDMIRHPDFIRDLTDAASTDQTGIRTCLEILADTMILLMQRQGIRPRYRRRAATRPHGETAPSQPIADDDQSDLFATG